MQSIYEPGKRHWLKVKKDYLAQGAMADSADLVVLGAFIGTGNKGRLLSTSTGHSFWIVGNNCIPDYKCPANSLPQGGYLGIIPWLGGSAMMTPAFEITWT